MKGKLLFWRLLPFAHSKVWVRQRHATGGGGTQFCQSSIQISMVVPPRFCIHTLAFSENDPLLAFFEHAASAPGLQSL